MKNKRQRKISGLNRLPSYIIHLISISAILAGIFLIFIYQQWKLINNNEELLTQYHLRVISTAYQIQGELSDLGGRVPKDISSLYMAQMMSEYNVDLNTQIQFSYKRKIISDLLARITALQKYKDVPLYMPAFNRLDHMIKVLLETLKYNETALRIESAAINLDLTLAKVVVEQYRRLHEREAKHVETVIDKEYQNLIWSASTLGIILLFMWSVLIIRSSAIIRKAIIKQQQSEEKVTESQQLLEAILNHASTCIYLKDIEGRYLFVNRQFELLFNISNKDYTGKTDYAIHSPEIADKLQTNDWEVLSTYESIDYEEVIKHDDGLHTYMSTKFPLFDPQGKIYALCGMSTDISKRKEIELNLRKLNLAVEQSPNLVVITNTEGVIEYVNRKITELTGYLPEDVIGKLPSIFKSEITPDSVYTELWNTISAGKEWRGILQNKKKNGDLYWAQESIAPVKNDAQEVTHYVAIQEDVTTAIELSDKLSY